MITEREGAMEAEVAREPESVWQARVSAWRASGLSRRDFCAAEGLSAQTFGWWVWRLSRAESEAGRFVPVTVTPDSAEVIANAVATSAGEPSEPVTGVPDPAAAAERIEIALPDGVVVRVGAGVDVAALRRVLTALGR